MAAQPYSSNGSPRKPPQLYSSLKQIPLSLFFIIWALLLYLVVLPSLPGNDAEEHISFTGRVMQAKQRGWSSQRKLAYGSAESRLAKAGASVAQTIRPLRATVRAASTPLPSQSIGLLPWLADEKAQKPPGCVTLQLGPHGVGSNFNFIIWFTAMFLQLHPGTKFYLNGSSVGGVCNGLAEVLAPALPSLVGKEKPPAGCAVWSKAAMIVYVRSYTSKRWVQYVGFNNGAGFMHQAAQVDMPLEARLRHEQIWDAMWQALCPVVRQFWRFPPEFQREIDAIKANLTSGDSAGAPVVAIHVRGGDKIANKTAEVPKSFDYTYERGIAAVAVQLAKAAAPGGRSHRPICVLVGDDAELMANVRKQAERVLMCATVKAMEPAGSVAPFGKGSNSCSKLQRMLVDMDLIAWANYTVGTMWSNFDSVAYYAAICSYKRSQESYVDGSAMVFGPYI